MLTSFLAGSTVMVVDVRHPHFGKTAVVLRDNRYKSALKIEAPDRQFLVEPGSLSLIAPPAQIDRIDAAHKAAALIRRMAA